MFLPTTIKEMQARGWDYVDVVLFTGDAYIDHPSFGAAVRDQRLCLISVIARTLRHAMKILGIDLPERM